jgi:ankyrin repeat protein
MARTSLHQTAVRGSQDRVRQTIDEGYDVNETDADGLTPLHMAAINKNYNAAKALLEAGAHVDVQDKWGNTPLWRAVFGTDSTVDLVELLVDHGADPAVENNSGNSPLKLAQRLQKTDYLSVFDKRNGPKNPT